MTKNTIIKLLKEEIENEQGVLVEIISNFLGRTADFGVSVHVLLCELGMSKLNTDEKNYWDTSEYDRFVWANLEELQGTLKNIDGLRRLVSELEEFNPKLPNPIFASPSEGEETT